MKKFIREFRIIPVVLIALCCLVVLKVAGLLLDGGYVLSDAQLPAESAKPSWAQDTLNFPTGRKIIDPSDVTGSVHGAPPAAETPVVKAAETRSPDEVVLYPDPKRPVTDSERAVLERLQARRQEIDTRAREIDIRENLMKAAEKRIEDRLQEVKATEARITTASQQKSEAESQRFKGIVTMYESMKPKDAAKVFDRLDISVLFDIASQIAPRKMSDILGQMQPEAAERLTVELARRAGSDSKMPSDGDLPKIEGQRPASAN